MRFLLVLVLLFGSLQAKTVEAKYKISFGVFGEIGVANAKLVHDDKTYHIFLEANTTGIAKSISGDRHEMYESIGEVKNGLLVPKIYKHMVFRKKRKSEFSLSVKKWKKVQHKKVKIYTFDYKNKQIVRKNKKFIERELKDSSKEVLEYFTSNDLLSLFFNFKPMLKSLNLEKPMKFKVVGGSKKDKEVEVASMSRKRQKEVFEAVNPYAFIALVNQPIFSSKKGELFMVLDEDGLCTKALLKDVLLFGDIQGEMVEKKIY